MSTGTMVSARDLTAAPRVAMTDPDLIEARVLAERYARGVLPLPSALTVTSVSLPGGHPGQLSPAAAGAVEILVNLALNPSPYEAAWVLLHEFQHVADDASGLLARMSYKAQEDRANRFAGEALRHPMFHHLSHRRPTGRAERSVTAMPTPPSSLDPVAAKRRRLLAEGHDLVDQVERARRRFTAGERTRGNAILAQLGALGTPSGPPPAQCPRCGGAERPLGGGRLQCVRCACQRPSLGVAVR